MTVEEYIKKNAKSLASSVFITPDIPEKKLNNAIVGMTESSVDPDYVVAVIDATVFGKCDDGVLFTGEAIYWHPFCEDIRILKYADLKNASVYIVTETDSKGRERQKKFFKVIGKDNAVLVDKQTNDFNPDKMADFLNDIVRMGESSENAFESTRQVMPLCDSDSETKLTYVKLVANFAFSDDGQVDGDEFAAIYNLMVRNDFAEQDRIAMRSYMFDAASMDPTQDLVANLIKIVPAGSLEATAISLIKDCIYINYKKGKELASWREEGFIKDLASRLSVTAEKIDFIVQVIKNDENILNNRLPDSEIEKAAKELAAKAAAVGVPIAAVYFSGSVIGLSAAGLTSGLASLGMGLGMVGGIGVAVLVGVAAYKGIKFLTSQGNVEACKQREKMIQNIIRNNQKSIKFLVDDTNYISAKLFDLIDAGNADKQKIEQLKRQYAMILKASQATTNGLINNVKEAIIAKLPSELNRTRFDRLTDSPTKIKVRPFVYDIYPEKVVSSKNSEGRTVEKTTYPILDTLPNESYERALKILKAVEYLAKD